MKNKKKRHGEASGRKILFVGVLLCTDVHVLRRRREFAARTEVINQWNRTAPARKDVLAFALIEGGDTELVEPVLRVAKKSSTCVNGYTTNTKQPYWVS
jgi:hypothetical protein